MHNPPPFPPPETFPIPDGHRLEWKTDDGWRLLGYGILPRPCRYTVGPDRTTCRADSVAELRRGRGWWAYCEEHLYGRTLHDGRIWTTIIVPE